MNHIAKVVLDVALDREFDYLVPDTLAAQVSLGSNVFVPFGRSKRLGYVVGFATSSQRTDLKPLLAVAGRVPLLTEDILKLARWMGDYYCAPVEHVVRTVLPRA
ncbi:MAG: primosomal protein N', partial [bacterium]